MWLRSHDGEADEPQLYRAGMAARGMHYWALCYVAKHGTDGHVPREVITALRGGPALAVRLVAVGKWQTTPEGFYIAAYLDMGNPTRAELEKQRRRERDKKRRQFARRESLGESLGETSGENGENPRTPRPVPSRPVRDEKTDGPLYNSTTIKYVNRLMLLLGEPHRQAAWLLAFSEAPEVSVVNAVEEFEHAVHKGGINNRGAYFQQIWVRHTSGKQTVGMT